MTKELEQMLNNMQVGKKVKAYFYDNFVTFEKVDSENVRMVVPKGGGEVYGPGELTGERRFSKAPVLPISDFIGCESMTLQEKIEILKQESDC